MSLMVLRWSDSSWKLFEMIATTLKTNYRWSKKDSVNAIRETWIEKGSKRKGRINEQRERDQKDS